MSNTIGIKRYSLQGLEELLDSWGEPRYRASQLFRWLYAEGATSYDQMSNLPLSLRLRLAAEEPLSYPEVLKRQVSSDGTRKYLLKLSDGQCIEAVGIPDRKRLTVCFSTQAGCAMGCAFCTTGLGGLARSLTAGEMVDQLTVIFKDMQTRITNAVAMGEGEPFANYDAVLTALRIMNSLDGLGIGARHLTVSTCGITRQIRRLAQEPEQFTLAVSLHSAVQSTRNLLMPSLTNQPLTSLKESLLLYADKTGRRPSLEVTLIQGVNDTPQEVAALVDFAREMLCHVNLIRFNPMDHGVTSTDSLSFRPSTQTRCREIALLLQNAHIECTLRQSKGSDIQGACGQLKGSDI